MQIGQVFECTVGGVDDVAPAVVPPVLPDSESACGAGNDLPQAGGAAVRVGERVVRALNDRQQGELQRQATRLELGGDVRQVALTAVEYAIQVVGVPHIPVQLGLDTRVHRLIECESFAKVLQQVVMCQPGFGLWRDVIVQC